jgi:hypothetical protein
MPPCNVTLCPVTSNTMISILQNKDDHLTGAQGGDEQRIGTQAETQGVTPWCAPMPRFWRYDVDAAS